MRYAGQRPLSTAHEEQKDALGAKSLLPECSARTPSRVAALNPQQVVQDLLVDVDTSLRVVDDRERGPIVVDLTEQAIESEAHLQQLLRAAEDRRQVSYTRGHVRSSDAGTAGAVWLERRCSAGVVPRAGTGCAPAWHVRAVVCCLQVRETRMNQKSSRSHMVVRLCVESRPAFVDSGAAAAGAPLQ
jgi:hypothetical protein